MNVHGCNVRDIGIHFPEEAEFTRKYNPLPFIGENRICYQCKPCPYCSVWFCSIKVTKDGTLNVRNVWSIHDECTYSPLSFYLFIYSENFRDFEFWIFSKSGCWASSSLTFFRVYAVLTSVTVALLYDGQYYACKYHFSKISSILTIWSSRWVDQPGTKMSLNEPQ